MDSATSCAESLRKQISAAEDELNRLREQLASVEAQEHIEKAIEGLQVGGEQAAGSPVTGSKWPLSGEEYRRYGRQMIVPNVGIQGTFSFSFFSPVNFS